MDFRYCFTLGRQRGEKISSCKWTANVLYNGHEYFGMLYLKTHLFFAKETMQWEAYKSWLNWIRLVFFSCKIPYLTYTQLEVNSAKEILLQLNYGGNDWLRRHGSSQLLIEVVKTSSVDCQSLHSQTNLTLRDSPDLKNGKDFSYNFQTRNALPAHNYSS